MVKKRVLDHAVSASSATTGRVTAREVDGRPARVLFVCIGNACRSPMAEGFARHYGSDVIEPQSAGLSPITRMPPLTIQVMQEKNIDLSAGVPKGLEIVNPLSFDLIVNLSGSKLPGNFNVPVEDWQVEDPFGRDATAFRKAADAIEHLVMRLVLQLRLGRHPLLQASPQPAKR